MATFSLPCLPQDQCLLFSLPFEIREQIFREIVEQHDDESAPYHEHERHYRPTYPAPKRSYTACLRTCQRIYNEAWFMPYRPEVYCFFEKEHLPDNHPQTRKFQRMLEARESLYRRRRRPLAIDCLHLTMPEHTLDRFPISMLESDYFLPRKVHLTVRHIDRQGWQFRQPIMANRYFTRVCRFPESVAEVCLELESLEQDRDEMDEIARQMVNKWMLLRADSMVMSAQASPIRTATWSRSSLIDGIRWLSLENRPEMLDYYIVTVTWIPAPHISREQIPDIQDPVPGLTIQPVSERWISPWTLTVEELENAGVPRGTERTKAWEMVGRWKQEQATLHHDFSDPDL